MLKVRITFFDELFPENSVQVETLFPERAFDRVVESLDWYYDYAEDMYYKLDDSIGMQIIGM